MARKYLRYAKKEGEEMLQGICVKADSAEVLSKGENYYLFPNGPEHYYVSKYPNQGAHKGCYHAERFKLKHNEIELHKDRLYSAELIYTYPGYSTKLFQRYFIRPSKTHCYFYKDAEQQKLMGCYPKEWFKDFEEIESVVESEQADVSDFDIQEDKPEMMEQLSLF
ncbi:hypothetical protein [Sutcliffiella sp. BMC8]|uniref:hypothetical protein n=1 Tax=Sutcliffiella sp. BMC8 TaxID=3073243 RepID=UPI0030CB2BC0